MRFIVSKDEKSIMKLSKTSPESFEKMIYTCQG